MNIDKWIENNGFSLTGLAALCILLGIILWSLL